ncbi:MAG: 30S ribosome-binding factor RbfA [Pseudomonadota bacterium]
MKRRSPQGPGGQSQRQLRVGELVRRALSDVLVRGEAHGLAVLGSAITVSEVRMTPDLRQATAFVMPLGGRRAEEALLALTEARGEIRRAVGRRVHLKFAPDFNFLLDESFDRYDKTREMLAQDRVARDLQSDHRDEG